MVLNTAMAKSLKEFADQMEGKTGEEFEAAAIDYIKRTLRDHERIIFNGDGYSEEWEKEAERRGLANHRTTPTRCRAWSTRSPSTCSPSSACSPRTRSAPATR